MAKESPCEKWRCICNFCALAILPHRELGRGAFVKSHANDVTRTRSQTSYRAASGQRARTCDCISRPWRREHATTAAVRLPIRDGRQTSAYSGQAHGAARATPRNAPITAITHAKGATSRCEPRRAKRAPTRTTYEGPASYLFTAAPRRRREGAGPATAMFSFGSKKEAPSPEEQVRQWTSELRKEESRIRQHLRRECPAMLPDCSVVSLALCATLQHSLPPVASHSHAPHVADPIRFATATATTCLQRSSASRRRW